MLVLGAFVWVLGVGSWVLVAGFWELLVNTGFVSTLVLACNDPKNLRPTKPQNP